MNQLHIKNCFENMPPILQETHAKIMKLEIEREALKKETSAKAKIDLKILKKKLLIFKEQTSEIELNGRMKKKFY
jgi:hypothetical protein